MSFQDQLLTGLTNGVSNGLASGLSKGLTGGLSNGITGGLSSVIPMSFSGSSSAKTGDTMSTFGADSSGFSVNFGNGVSQGGSTPDSIPSYYWLIGAFVAYMVWKKKLS